MGDSETWTIQRLLTTTQNYFIQKDIPSARLDAEILLAHVLKKNRVYLYTHYDQPLSAQEVDDYRDVVRRRSRYEPVAYILGEKEFYGHVLHVRPGVLVPRPETELVVEEALKWLKHRAIDKPALLDLCTGSGAIAIALAKELPDATIVATDISAEALTIARENIAKFDLAAQIQLFEGDLLSALPKDSSLFDVIVSNPPYVATSEQSTLSADIRDFEPPLALLGGSDGLTIIKRLCAEARTYLRAPGALIVEMGATQKGPVLALCSEAGFVGERVVQDLQGLDRVVVAEKI